MQVIETTAHIGADGMLRIEVPVKRHQGEVRVAVVVESEQAQAVAAAPDKWSPIRAQLVAAGISVPPLGKENSPQVEPVSLPGTSASEMLIADRR